MAHQHQPIPRIVLRWAFILGALLVVGPAVAALTQSLRGADGGPDATLLASASPMWGAFVGVVALLAAFLFALPAGVLFGPRLALALAGFIIGWATWTTGTVDDLIRAARGGSPYPALIAEAAIYAILGTLLAIALVGLSREAPHGDRAALPAGAAGLRQSLRELPTRSGLVGLAVAVAAGGFIARLVAIEPLKGQTVFAAFLAAIAGGAAARLAAGSIKESPPAAPIAAFAAMCVLAVGSPVLGAVRAGTPVELLAASDAGALPALSLVLPLDWLAGALLGVPVGLAWAASLIDSDGSSAAASRPKA